MWSYTKNSPSGTRGEPLLRPLHEVDRSRPDAPNTNRIQQIGIEYSGQAKDQDSRSRRMGSGLLDGRCGPGPETVPDRLRQSRLIHLPFYAGDDLSFSLDLTFLFHKVSLH